MEVGDSHDSNMATSKLIGWRQERTNQANYISAESSHVGLHCPSLEISRFYLEFELYAGKYRSVTIPYYLKYVTVNCIVLLTAQRQNGSLAWTLHGFEAFSEKNSVVTWKNWYLVTGESYFMKYVAWIQISYTVKVLIGAIFSKWSQTSSYDKAALWTVFFSH